MLQHRELQRVPPSLPSGNDSAGTVAAAKHRLALAGFTSGIVFAGLRTLQCRLDIAVHSFVKYGIASAVFRSQMSNVEVKRSLYYPSRSKSLLNKKFRKELLLFGEPIIASVKRPNLGRGDQGRNEGTWCTSWN